MAGQFRVSGIDVDSKAFLSALKVQIGKMKLRTESDLLGLAVDVERRAKQLSPVDTGRLRSSIAHKQGRDSRGPYVEIGTSVSYAGFVEFGTRYQPPQPFLRPAFAEAISSAARRFRQ